MHGMAVWHGTSGRDRDESRQAKCVTGGKSCIVRASACLLDAAKERAQRLARPRRNSSSTGQWRKRWPGARVVDALSPTNYCWCWCWCWCWCCCSRWRSHYLLLLSSRSSDHTLMHVARTRIQTSWEAANRRESKSDPRAFVSPACQRQCHRFLQRHLPSTIVFFTDRDDAYPPRMPSPQSPYRIGRTALM
jgi:hypothetical protein